MKKRLMALLVAAGLLFGALPANAVHSYTHPCTSHTQHSTTKMLMSMPGHTGVWSHTAYERDGGSIADIAVWYAIYWKPSAQHSNWTYKTLQVKYCNE